MKNEGITLIYHNHDSVHITQNLIHSYHIGDIATLTSDQLEHPIEVVDDFKLSIRINDCSASFIESIDRNDLTVVYIEDLKLYMDWDKNGTDGNGYQQNTICDQFISITISK